MEHHPLADLFPMMSDAEFADLKADIEANGLTYGIWTYEGKILDGRNRWRACQELGVEVKTREFTGSNPVAFVLSMNLKRRHLTESQRGIVAARLANMTVGGDRKSKNHSANLQNDPPQISQSDAAKMLNVSTRTVATAAKVVRQAAPELTRAVETGDVKLAAAAKVAELPKAEQKKAVKAGPKAVKAAARSVPKNTANGEGGDEGGEDDERAEDGARKGYDVLNDIEALTQVIKQLMPNWSDEADKAQMRQFFKHVTSWF